MNTTARYVILVLGVIISLHYILSFSNQDYGRATSISSIKSALTGGVSNKWDIPDTYSGGLANSLLSGTANTTRANATFVVLARNSDLDSIIRSMNDMEYRFNRNWNYPYVFLNEEPFTEDFKKRISVLTDAKVEFGVIPHDDWYQPSWIDEQKATDGRNQMMSDNVIYGGSISYRNMCRFNSGFFFKHELLLKYRYYWRIEPDVHFHCNVDKDPFLFMQETGKVYGFTIAMYEFEKTIMTLWPTVKEFIKLHPEHIAENNAMGFMSTNGGDSYNLCHFWSNFEIADMDFWRGPAYTDFFEYLDATGGFYYERWGDAPIHSIAAALFLPKDKIHFFEEIGYEHNPYTHCPKGEDKWKKGKCACDPKRNFDYDGYSCMRQWDRIVEV